MLFILNPFSLIWISFVASIALRCNLASQYLLINYSSYVINLGLVNLKSFSFCKHYWENKKAVFLEAYTRNCM